MCLHAKCDRSIGCAYKERELDISTYSWVKVRGFCHAAAVVPQGKQRLECISQETSWDGGTRDRVKGTHALSGRQAQWKTACGFVTL